MRAKWIIKLLQKIFGTLKNGSLGSLNTTVTDFTVQYENSTRDEKAIRIF